MIKFILNIFLNTKNQRIIIIKGHAMATKLKGHKSNYKRKMLANRFKL